MTKHSRFAASVVQGVIFLLVAALSVPLWLMFVFETRLIDGEEHLTPAFCFSLALGVATGALAVRFIRWV